MYSQIDSNKRRSVFLIAIFVGVLAAAGYVYGYLTETGWFGLILALAISGIWTFVSWYGGSRIALSVSGAEELKHREQFPTLWNGVENLAITAGIPKPKIFIIEDPSPNAFATGRDPEHASVAVTTGLLRLLDRSELEGVLAHELAHIKNYDTRLMVLAAALAGALVLLGDFLFRGMLFGGRGRDRENGHPLFLILGLLFIILSPLVGELIKLAISRKREYLADASGALLTRYPEGLASALEKISRTAIPIQRRSTATNHLWISNPAPTAFRSRLSGFFSTHPPAPDRIRRLRQMT